MEKKFGLSFSTAKSNKNLNNQEMSYTTLKVVLHQGQSQAFITISNYVIQSCHT